ncbi:sugar phosphate isomerase/epimerase family protein [Fructilactobacillus florum]|uniref:Sugar phosphate isomerase epimerase n=1 Tax=Fructilactobacillus florum DSM 22689 = JCM 16035 TaxID=1423745 RepID=A0A0R2CEN7_9LACO|nr:TIM barrel protein [Fructilactobacillus florum]KRM90205.1 sugar phosphate isomerase epimerase [Fructilactobacillus florum DSM 22689 = JCM 16035]
MEKNNLVLNNLVFANARAQGELQLEMLHTAVSLGITNVEIRREFFKNIPGEIKGIRAYAEQHGLTLFYSVPDELFIGGKLNAKLTTYFTEAQQLGIHAIKFNIGEFKGFKTEQLIKLEHYGRLVDQINVENDQTQQSGSLAAIVNFLDAARRHGLQIGYVYDLGNWCYVDEDPLQAATMLTEHVSYIHLKDCLGSGKQTVTVPLGDGELPWETILQQLPQDVPVALEYPTASQAVLEAGIAKLTEGD